MTRAKDPGERSTRNRRLAAVWFADIVGFTSLSSRDEDAAMKLVAILQDVTRRAVKERGGTVVKFLGDGGLAVFPSSDAATRAGLAVQREFAERASAAGCPATLRIAIHVGEVIGAPDGDVYGDGVNIAARIQREAEPGQVVVSGDVRRQLRQRSGYQFQVLGERSLRGVEEPVEICVVAGVPEETEVGELTGAWRPSSIPRASTRLIMVGGALAVGLIGWWAITGREADRPPAEPAEGSPTKSASSIAVLPFADLSPGGDQEYFGDGMTEEIINALTRVEGLDVVSRTSAFAYKGQNLDVREIGRRLDVRTVMEGSVRVAGDRLRIAAQLINVDNGYHIWSETYDREMADVFAIQEEIARAIVTALEPEFASASEALVARGTGNPEAYRLYLQGRFHWNKRTREGVTRAIELFEEAIRADSSYALAYAGLADSYNMLRARGFLTAEETVDRERAAAKKALELDETLSEAHTSLGALLFNYDWDWEGAEREYRRAIELDPRNANARHWYSHYLIAMGRTQESLDESIRAIDISPFDVILSSHLAWHYLFAREYDRAVEQGLKTEEMDPGDVLTHGFLASAYAFQGRSEPALAKCREALAISRGDAQMMGWVGYAYGSLGHEREALGIARELEARGAQTYYAVAIIYAGLSNRDRAFELLERAYTARSPNMTYLAVDPRLDVLRGDSRYRTLLRKMRLDEVRS